jgi:hypothetical protein
MIGVRGCTGARVRDGAGNASSLVAVLPIFLLLPLLLFPAAASAQAVDPSRAAPPLRIAVAPETVTVGDRFRVAVSVDLPSADSVALIVEPDSLGRWQTVGAPRSYRPDSVSRSHRAAATMVSWVTVAKDSAAATLRIFDGDGKTEDRSISIPLPVVRSVLPADTAKHRPRPAKDVYGSSRDWRLVALIATGILLLLGLLAFLLLGRRKKKPRAVAMPDARQRALSALERAGASGTAEAGEWKAFYSQVSGALRAFAEECEARWSADLTTTELLARMREDGVAPDDARPLAGVLRDADLAKFARHPLTLDMARRDLGDAKRWVETFDRPAPVSAENEVVAGVGGGAP